MGRAVGTRKNLFISSVQKELAKERRAVKEFVEGDALLSRYFDVFLFEDTPAKDRMADDVYLDDVGLCDVYIGIFGMEYGSVDNEGLSATEREFDFATERGKTRLIFVLGTDDKARDPEMLKLVQKAGKQLIRRRFADIPALTSTIYASLVEYLEESGSLSTLPFDASACPRAALEDIEEDNIKQFLQSAKQERNFALSAGTNREKALVHLNLLDDGKPTRAAILLFGKEPQRYLPTSEVKCMHYHGTEVKKPIPSYQVFKGTAFELVDQAVDFVLSRINRSIGVRAVSARAPSSYELPTEAITEAIVNAVAHRDYTSNASVQVMLFSDRLEVWNPGELPPSLTPELLREPHSSIPHNPLIAEPLYLARYIEKAGSGTIDMIERCRAAGVPAPDFEERSGQFVVTLWREWLTPDVIDALDLNDRQRKVITYLKTAGRIGNAEYQALFDVAKRTASRDLVELVEKGVLERIGVTGKGTEYILRKGVAKRPKGPEQV